MNIINNVKWPVAKSTTTDEYIRLPDIDSIPTYVLVSESAGQILCGLGFYIGQNLYDTFEQIIKLRIAYD